MNNDIISRSALLAEMKVSGKAAYMLVQEAPAVDCIAVLRAQIEADIAAGELPCTIGNRLLRYVMSGGEHE